MAASPVCALCRRPQEDLAFGSLLAVDDSQISHLTRNIISVVVVTPRQTKTLCSKCCRELAFVGRLLFKWRERIVLALDRAEENCGGGGDVVVKKEEIVDRGEGVRSNDGDWFEGRFGENARVGGEEEEEEYAEEKRSGYPASPDRSPDPNDGGDVDEGPSIAHRRLRRRGKQRQPPDDEEENVDNHNDDNDVDNHDGVAPNETPSTSSRDDSKRPNEDVSDDDEDDDANARESSDSDGFVAYFDKSKRKRSKKAVHACHVCGKVLPKKDALKRHLATHVATKAKPSKNEAKPNPKPTGKELKETNSQRLDALLAEESKKEKATFPCPECGKVFKVKFFYDRHVADHSAVFRCHVCGKVRKDRKALLLHLARHRDEGKKYACDQCGKVFNSDPNLHAHKKRMHGGKRTHLCRYCPLKFWCPSNLRAHERVHTKEKPFSCGQCDKKFREKRMLKMHKEVIHGDRIPKWPCAICGKSFLSRDYCRNHLTFHEPPTKPCAFRCGRMFRTNQKVKEHGRACPFKACPRSGGDGW